MDTNLACKRTFAELVDRAMSTRMDHDENCATWAAGVVHAIHGVDFLKAWGGDPLKDHPGRLGIFMSRAARRLGWARCQPGDEPIGAPGLARNVFSDAPGQQHVAVVANGLGWYVARTRQGVTFYQADQVVWLCRPQSPPR